MAVNVDYAVVKSGRGDSYRVPIKAHWRSLPNNEGFTLFKQKISEVCGYYPSVLKDADGALITCLDTVSTGESLQLREPPPEYDDHVTQTCVQETPIQIDPIETSQTLGDNWESDEISDCSNKLIEFELKLSNLSAQMETVLLKIETKDDKEGTCSTSIGSQERTEMSEIHSRIFNLERTLNETRKEFGSKLSRVPVSPNLIKNSLMRIVGPSGNPRGFEVCAWLTGGKIECKAVHPFTQGFEGCFSREQPANSIRPSESHLANQIQPVFFDTYCMGPRISRGGLSTGWHSISDGNILRISGERVDKQEAAIHLPVACSGAASNVRFAAWMKCVTGSVLFSVGLPNWDNPESLLNRTRIPGLCRAEDCKDCPQGWFHMDDVISIANITSLNGKYSFILRCFGPTDQNGLGEFEIYIALPYASLVECPQKVTVVPFVDEWN